ncbi:HD domain-containing phosphohydrolase [Corallincola spongiicola]|uniref:HDOD domain-containing protein n=1 Tax=Corallincola spongiicola TaxID=2520508 RepID=A0ABY1WN65_9GAMM|nr:HD domain-containing phosphohydrolase [Corallincola spongiicola]TAA43742.1 hypothetical protein EXY25_14455 [Corallincola spongiicola]
MKTRAVDKSLHIKHPDTLYLAVDKLFRLSTDGPSSQFVVGVHKLAKIIYQSYPLDAPVIIAHLSLHNDKFSLAVNEALNCAILTCALGYQSHWSSHHVVPLIAAAISKDIADLQLNNNRFDGTRFNEQETLQWHNRGDRAKQWLSAAGVTSALWLEAVAGHAAKMDGSGYPALAGYQLTPAVRLLSWCSFFSEQICPRANRTGLRPRQIIRYALGRRRHAFDRQLINKTAQIFAPIQPGAVIKTEDKQHAIVIGRQNRREAIITSVVTKDLDIQQCNISGIIKRYPTQIDKGRHFLARLIRGWQQMQAQSITLLDGLQIARQETLSPEKITEVAYLFELEEPDIPALARLLTEYPSLLSRLALQAQRLSRRQLNVSDPKQILMMLGLERASPLVQRNAMLEALEANAGPYQRTLSSLIECYSAFCSLMAEQTKFADIEKTRIISTAQCAGFLLSPELIATRPANIQNNGQRPGFWFKQQDNLRLESLSLAFAKRWQLPPFALNALLLAAERVAPNASRKAIGYAHLLKLCSQLYQHFMATGEMTLKNKETKELAVSLGINDNQLKNTFNTFIQQYHPYTPLD